MAFNFPTSPILNQSYTSGNSTWVWNGYAWDKSVAGLTLSTSRSTVTATNGQTVFSTPFYTIGTNQINVFINGVRQLITTDYTETTTSSITLTSGAVVGDVVAFEVNAAAVNPFSGSVTITDENANATRYLLLSANTSGTLTQANTSSADLYFNPSTGTLTLTSLVATSTVSSTSDARLKENLTPLQDSITTLNKINTYGFDWKSNGKKSYGVIAQELEEILPELVTTQDNGIKTVSYTTLIPFLINTVQEQQKQIDELKDIIKKLG